MASKTTAELNKEQEAKVRAAKFNVLLKELRPRTFKRLKKSRAKAEAKKAKNKFSQGLK